MTRIKWQGSQQDSPYFGALKPGEEYEVPASVAEAWIAAGAAERVRAKARREAAPESAVSQE